MCEHLNKEIISQIRHANVYVCHDCHEILLEENGEFVTISLDRLGELIQVEINEAKKATLSKIRSCIADITL